MEAKQTSQCPICQKEFKMSIINRHVNDCLNGTSNDLTITEPSRKRKSSDAHQVSAWGCLKPGGNSGKIESSGSPETAKRRKSNHTSVRSTTASPILVDGDSNEAVESLDDIIPSIELHPSNSPNNSFGATTSSASGERQNFNSTALSNPYTISSPNNDSDSAMNSTHTASQGKSLNPFFQKKSKGDSSSAKAEFSPLAEQMRPSSLDKYVGQDKAVGEKSLLHSLLRSDHVPSMILWGPPGCGKTTLARIVAARCKAKGNAKFVPLSATTSGVNDVKEVIKVAKNDQKMLRRKTVLFLDEIHRFNKSQQDTLLPHVEDGTIILIGATTENPSFQVNSALLSRCRVIVLEKLSVEALKMILSRALKEIDAKIFDSMDDVEFDEDSNRENDLPVVWIENQAIDVLANLCDGDARAALNSLQMAVQARIAFYQSTPLSHRLGCKSVAMVTTDHIKDGLQRSHVLYDKTGEEHYNIISALHKSIRGSDASASLYWLARMLEGGENPLYVSRRLVRCASEDIGLADHLALNQAVAAFQACHLIGMPECEVILAQCVVYLARAPKSVEMYEAYDKAKKCVQQHQGPLPGVPLHLRNAPTKLMKNLGYGKGYKYNPAFKNPVNQDYFPEELLGTDFFK